MSAQGNRRPEANGTAVKTHHRQGVAAIAPTLPEAARAERDRERLFVVSLTCYAALPPSMLQPPLGDICCVCNAVVDLYERDGCPIEFTWRGPEPVCWDCAEALTELRDRLRRERFERVMRGQGIDIPPPPPIDLQCYACDDERRAS